jgi:hypothetical protein
MKKNPKMTQDGAFYIGIVETKKIQNHVWALKRNPNPTSSEHFYTNSTFDSSFF